MNLPNKLSVLRLIMVPLFTLFFYLPFSGHYFVAAIVFVLAAATDFLDGYIARKYGLVTNLGKFLDASADKVLVLCALILFADANIVPFVWVGIGVSVIMAREIMISCLRMVAASKGVVMAADKLGKIKTFCQDAAIAILLIAKSFSGGFFEVFYYIGLGMFALSVLLTVVSGINYFVINKNCLKES